MIANLNFDVTPIGDSRRDRGVLIGHYTPISEPPSIGREQTMFVVLSNGFEERRASLATVTGEQPKGHRPEATTQPLLQEALLEKTANDRTVLLARKYAGQGDNEQLARLEILTQRMRKLVPRVTPEAVDAIENSLSQIEARRERRAEMASRRGMT